MKLKKIIFLGSGNVATHLAQALCDKGNEILQVYSRSMANAKTLADRVGAEPIDGINDLRADADIYVISVKDDTISSVATRMCDINPSAIVLHTAGSVPLSILSQRFENAAILYPLQTFSKSRVVDFSVIPCFIEASNQQTLEVVKTLASTISSRVVEADSGKRAQLHIAAVFACNMVNHCYHLAECLMKEAGLDFQLLYPLISETTRKIQYISPKDAQTGPMVRNDVSVMNAQKQMLADDDMREIYEAMERSVRKRHTIQKQ